MVQAVAIFKQLEQHHDALERLGVKPPPHAHTWPDLASWARHALLDERDPAMGEQDISRSRMNAGR